MNKAEKAGLELAAMDELAKQSSPVHSLSPLCKLLVTVAYIIVTVSFHKYDITGLFVMVLFPILGYQLSMIPVRTCFYRLRIVMPLVMAVGLFNPFFDREVILTLGNIGVSGGVISMLTLMMKGVFCLMMSFLLIATTSIDGICRGLRQLHFPKMFTSLILLTFRYISLLLDEVSVMTEAYSLRAPGQKGIHISAWGSFLGQLLLKTMDRADALYESMVLRGFNGEFYYAEKKYETAASWIVFIVMTALIILVRFFNPAAMLGNLFI